MGNGIWMNRTRKWLVLSDILGSCAGPLPVGLGEAFV